MVETHNAEVIWKEALALIATRINEGTYRIWFSPTSGMGFVDDTFVVGVTSDFAKDWIDTRFHALIADSLSQVVGDTVSCQIVYSPELALFLGRGDHDSDAQVQQPIPGLAPSSTVRPQAPIAGSAGRSTPSQDPKEPHPAPSGSALGLNEKYSFDNFVIGPSNRFAHAAALATAETPGTAYNPLVIYGGVGLGKTHLLQAIGHYVFANMPQLRVRYMTIEMFTNDFINSLRDDTIEGFKRRYRSNDVLLIDDIQFLEKKEQTQEEFFHTFNTLYEAGKQIVITSDRPPKALQTLEDRLVSRFEWGLITDIQPPDLETRIAILRKRVRFEAIQIHDDSALTMIASRVPGNIRELEGCLTRVVAYASFSGRPINAALVTEVLKDIPDTTQVKVTVEHILSVVSTSTGISVTEIRGDKRSRNIVLARHLAMYLARELTDISLPRIGERFGGRDHTTVLHAVEKMTKLVKQDREMYNMVQQLTSRIKTAT
jgi:chromosomal replication initiator protein